MERLSKKRGVVLVGLDHEERRPAQPCRHAEVLRDAADQEAGREARHVQDPGQHAGSAWSCRGCRQRPAPSARAAPVREPLRARGVAQAALEDGLDQRIAARHRVADDEAVAIGGQRLGAVAFVQLDAGRFELGAHRRIDVGVRTANLDAEFAGDERDTRHEGAADAENVDFHLNNQKAIRW